VARWAHERVADAVARKLTPRVVTASAAGGSAPALRAGQWVVAVVAVVVVVVIVHAPRVARRAPEHVVLTVALFPVHRWPTLAAH